MSLEAYCKETHGNGCHLQSSGPGFDKQVCGVIDLYPQPFASPEFNQFSKLGLLMEPTSSLPFREYDQPPYPERSKDLTDTRFLGSDMVELCTSSCAESWKIHQKVLESKMQSSRSSSDKQLPRAQLWAVYIYGDKL
jgi:hypothetical protein